MENKKIKLMSLHKICLICCLLVIGVLLLMIVSLNQEEDKELFSVSDHVKVSKSIIEGYEDKDYIPRSVSINKKLGDINGN